LHLIACLVLLFPLFSVATPPQAPVTPSNQQQQVTETITTTAIVNGMVCDFCARGLEKTFKKYEAVQDVHVNLASQNITITTSKNNVLPHRLIKRITQQNGITTTTINVTDQARPPTAQSGL